MGGKEKKIFAISDVHGCYKEMMLLFKKLPLNPKKDLVVFMGDYIDRGDDPRGVVDYILTLRKRSFSVQCLLGNHEAMFLDYLSGKIKYLYLANGGTSTLRSYGEHRPEKPGPSVPPEHMSFYHSLKPYIELQDYYVVHAGFRPGVDIEEQSLEDMIWIRGPFIYSNYDFGKRVIFGHTPFFEPLIMKNKIGIDTGAVSGNRLTCLELPEEKFSSVEMLSGSLSFSSR